MYVYTGSAWVPVATEDASQSAYLKIVDSQPSFRNLIINGDMQVAQRATSVTGITTSTYNTADRWQVYATSLGTWTQTVENDAPTGSGFRKSLKMLCTTADASPATNDSIEITQILEGQNLQQIRKGTGSAQPLSLTFWVKANVTGTYTVWIYDGDNARAVAAQYTISTSATWEKKSIVIPADTTGVFDNDNAASLYLRFGLGFGSGWTSGTLASSWQSYTQANVGVGQVNVGAATNNYWQITGVQLEVGPIATPFEFLPANLELAACQRYFQIFDHLSMLGGRSSTTLETSIVWQIPMRATPVLTALTAYNVYDAFGGGFTQSSPNIGFAVNGGTSKGGFIALQNFTGLTQGRTYITNAANSGSFSVSAEL
jgi:hypothetical protein